MTDRMDIRLTTTNQNFKIEKYTDKDRVQILNVWEKSVLATHDFLSPTDFEEIKQLDARTANI